MELEVRHLRALCAIAETGSLTRAAASLRMSQPGLSAQLRRIEARLGGQLFHRLPGGVVPTSFGELVLARAKAVLPAVDELVNVAKLASRSLGERAFRLGSITAPLASGLISALKALHPNADITCRGHHTPQPLVDDVAAGRLEAAVVGENPGYEVVPPTGVVLHRIATEPVFAVLPATHPLAAREEVALADLLDEDWVVPRPEDRTSEYWSRVVLGAGGRLRARYEADGRLLVDLVRHGHAVSLCQATFDEVPGIAVRPLAGNPISYRYLLAWHRDGPLAAAGEAIGRRVAQSYHAASALHPVYTRWRLRHGVPS
ncbi:MAG: LysR family transcriptional regulator [Saccharothrix sp.]|nr:LysR family transcriptional regulator [Saccharothrix sp.]